MRVAAEMNDRAATNQLPLPEEAICPPVGRLPVRAGGAGWTALVLALAAVLLLPTALQNASVARLVLAVSVLAALAINRSNIKGFVCLLAFQSFLGGMRRNLVTTLGWSAFDPLLLIAPCYILLYVVPRVLARRVRTDSVLSRSVLLLVAVMAVQVLNPRQGGILVGLGGVMYLLVPLLWFYLGQALGTERTAEHVVLWTVAIATAAAGYGLYQTFYGFTPSEEAWLQLAHWNGLQVGSGITRPFSFMSQPAEYADFLSFGVAVLWALWLRRRAFPALLLCPVLVVALFLLSGRGAIVLVLIAVCALTSVQGASRASWLPRALVVGVIASAGLIWGLHGLQEHNDNPYTHNLIAHQTEGLLHPEQSDAVDHTRAIVGGVTVGFIDPLGRGLGTPTMAAGRFGGSGGDTEFDVSDMFLALGLFGGLVYLVVVGTVFATALKLWCSSRSFASLAILGMLSSSLGHWLLSGRYAALPLIWFLIGALDRMDSEVSR